MGIESQGPPRPAGNLTPKQVKTFQNVEPKALGSIQIIIAVLCLCLSITILQLYEEVHFSPDVIVVVVIVVQLLVSGSILIHAGRFPSLFWVKATLVAHLVSAAFSTAVLGLLSRHLPYRQDTYHCEHCRRLEIYAVLLIDGFLATLVLFLVVELAICIVTILFGLNALAKGGMQLPGFRQRAVPSQPEAVTPSQPQVEVLVSEVEPMPEREPEPKSEPIEELPSPPTEPQVAPIDSLTDV
ncbi:high affinity immunoglobulin epsilon receptor subunit beta isoform X2 [Puntigrus tetrazona]|uniref:high affinity immunoglobulin epsilon receptor subunit beta isoform X2 n=1 Tax=Puntigrus tetrazona TaxID=1606681 RepID=UPI001C8AB3CC|nr:high affinity immunoglobulin epsilon receptor subunit beta isoform X2 [Puntigrus tetrazona]